jgi:hypothetical protein
VPLTAQVFQLATAAPAATAFSLRVGGSGELSGRHKAAKAKTPSLGAS